MSSPSIVVTNCGNALSLASAFRQCEPPEWPALYHDLVIVNSISASTVAIDATTQRVIWGFASPAAVNSTVAGVIASGDTVFVDGGDQKMYALRATDGGVIWSAGFTAQTTRDLVVTPRRVIFTNGGTLYVLDRQSGQQIAAVTQPRTSDPLFASAPAFGNGLIVTSVADAVWCFDEP